MVTAIHEVNPLQRMAIMTADPKDAKRKLPEPLLGISVPRKPFNLAELLGLLRDSPCCRFDLEWSGR